MKENIFKDNFSEAIFAQAVRDDFEREMARITEDNSSFEFTERHMRRMSALFTRERQREQFRRALNATRRVAAVLVLLVALNAALLVVPAVRAAVGSVIGWFDKYVQFSGGDTSNTEARLEPSVLPDGFAEINRVDDDTFTSITYIRADGETLIFTRIQADNSISINNEGVEYGQQTEAGIVYHTFAAVSEDYISSVVWDMNGSRFCLGARLPIDDLLTAARSVERIK